MSEKLDSLIEKINREGVEAAEKKAKSIIAEAGKKAREEIENAEKEGKRIVEEAEKEARAMENKAKKSLQQAYRDVIIALKKEIEKIFNQILKIKISESLSPEELLRLINELVVKWVDWKGDIAQVYLNEEDAKKIGDMIVSEMKKKMKKGVEIKPVKDIDAGFMVSFDDGRSRFDFTDNGLGEFIKAHLNQRLIGFLEDKEQ